MMRLSCAGRAVEPAAQYAHHRLTLISLSKLSGEEKSWSDVCVHGTAGRAPPMAPVAFAVKLESGVATTSSQNRIDPGSKLTQDHWGWSCHFKGQLGLSSRPARRDGPRHG